MHFWKCDRAFMGNYRSSRQGIFDDIAAMHEFHLEPVCHCECQLPDSTSKLRRHLLHLDVVHWRYSRSKPLPESNFKVRLFSVTVRTA